MSEPFDLHKLQTFLTHPLDCQKQLDRETYDRMLLECETIYLKRFQGNPICSLKDEINAYTKLAEYSKTHLGKFSDEYLRDLMKLRDEQDDGKQYDKAAATSLEIATYYSGRQAEEQKKLQIFRSREPFGKYAESAKLSPGYYFYKGNSYDKAIPYFEKGIPILEKEFLCDTKYQRFSLSAFLEAELQYVHCLLGNKQVGIIKDDKLVLQPLNSVSKERLLKAKDCLEHNNWRKQPIVWNWNGDLTAVEGNCDWALANVKAALGDMGLANQLRSQHTTRQLRDYAIPSGDHNKRYEK